MNISSQQSVSQAIDLSEYAKNILVDEDRPPFSTRPWQLRRSARAGPPT